jgi:hypothetical protein
MNVMVSHLFVVTVVEAARRRSLTGENHWQWKSTFL